MDECTVTERVAKRIVPVAAALLLLAGCGDSPGDVALKFNKAVCDGNLARAASYLAPGVEMPADTAGAAHDFVVEKVTKEASSATVILRKHYAQTPPPFAVELVKVGGDWRLKAPPLPM